MNLPLIGLIAGAVLCTQAQAENWFAVARPGQASPEVQVEVDLDTVRARGSLGEGVIRVSYRLPRVHQSGFAYQSFIATAQFDCPRRAVGLASAAYFARPQGEGERVGTDSSGRAEGMPAGLLDSVPVPTRHALLRATCATTQQSS